MDETTKRSLASAMDDYEKRQAQSQKKSDDLAVAREKFLADFKQVRKDVIRPVMDEFLNELRLRGQGYDAKISEDPDSLSKLQISFRLCPKLRGAALTFAALEDSKEVLCLASNLSPSWDIEWPKVSITEVNAEMVNEELLKFVCCVFGDD